MNLQEIAAIAEKSLTFTEGALNAFKAHHHNLLLTDGIHAEGESYKFTNLKRFIEEMPKQTPSMSLPETEENTFVFIDGKLTTSPKITGLSYSGLTEDALKTLSSHAPLSHLHHSLMGPGLLIEVEKNIELKEPVKIIHITKQSSITASTIFIKMGQLSKMTLIEETGLAQVSETYLELLDGAHLEHLQLDSEIDSNLQHGSTWVRVAQDASYSNFIFHLNGKLNRRNLDIKLNSPGANAESYALFLTGGNEHSDISTVINHMAPDTTSKQIAKGILGGESKGVFTGKIHIHPKAQRVASAQINRNLLLSKKAHVHSQPQLEIFADDVKCSHGSTTGQMSEEEVFYFEARGIPADKARTLLAFGFGLEVVLKIKNLKARKEIENAVMANLKEKFHLGGPA